jgi:hypothetical protein
MLRASASGSRRLPHGQADHWGCFNELVDLFSMSQAGFQAFRGIRGRQQQLHYSNSERAASPCHA